MNGPVILGNKGINFILPITNQAQGHGLHPSGGFAARQLSPQHGGQGKAHQIIQRPPRQIRINQRLIQGPRLGQCILHGGFGDFAEHHALNRFCPQNAPVFQDFVQMPRNGLPFAVGVGGQNDFFGILGQIRNGFDLLGGAGIGFPDHGKVFFGIHRPRFRRQIPHVPITGHHGKVAAQIFVDGFGLGR